MAFAEESARTGFKDSRISGFQDSGMRDSRMRIQDEGFRMSD
jgi:hypothetical protein